MSDKETGKRRQGDIRTTDSKPLRTDLTAEERNIEGYGAFIDLINAKKEAERASDAGSDSPSGEINPELLK